MWEHGASALGGEMLRGKLRGKVGWDYGVCRKRPVWVEWNELKGKMSARERKGARG